ncbi:hypothetical protein EDB81DRAFT_891727 [Dactylonectria macrodidyma]|uniref:Uncharacterized protein n=1 Tax=Dactylonectria macrodidyma TaxID=307937 RepID=A0A9P9IGZ3_9HYPO|nr:hypothetical protein EDB81DRAFT_891727 [Dactylonectria macrodidyma]
MAPIAYSKWDNIDTDSEPQTPTQQSAAPASTGSVQAVIVRCDGERLEFAPWSATTIQADHPVFSHAVPPVPGLIEVPLVLHRVGTQSANRTDLDNQIATYLK